jgi:hypothetical protein
MKLRELFEKDNTFDGALKTIGVCFGRWNPPHRGHREVWKQASKNPVWYVGTNESTSGPKDPLPYDIKLQAMAAVWPAVAGHVIPEQSLLTLASRIYQEHGDNVHLKVYTDEDWLIKTLTQYNGVEKEHGLYKFQQIDHVRTQRLASATDLRKAAREGDRARFYKDMGIKPTVTIKVNNKQMPVFDVVAHYLNMYPEKTKRHTVAEAKPTEDLIPDHFDDSHQGNTIFRDVGGYDRTYHLNRIMMAAAMADGKSKKKLDMDPHSFVEKYNVVFPYTDLEHAMMLQAFATVPTDKKELSKRGKSEEPKDTNIQSVVAKPKKNKYGI